MFRKSKAGNLFTKLLVPIMAVLLLQLFLFSGFIFGIVIPETTRNAYKILNERVINRKTYLENEMIQRWSNLDLYTNAVHQNVAAVLAAEGASIKDIEHNSELNAMIIEKNVPDIISLLRKNAVTGAFFILNGASLYSRDSIPTYPGVYFRDLDPTNFSEDGLDILMERGLPSVSKNYDISLDSFWTANFEFPGGGTEKNEYFFFKPLNAAQESGNRYSRNFAYWSNMFTLAGDATPVITYSIPLIYSDGTVYGVLGIDITENYLRRFLPYEEIGNSPDSIYVLAITDHRRAQFEPVCINARAYSVRFDDDIVFAGAESGADSVYRFSDDGISYYGSVQPFRLYNSNTPFAGQQWVLIGMEERWQLLEFPDRLKYLLLIISTVSLFLGICCVYIAQRIVIKPISSVAQELESVNTRNRVTLTKTNIREIDRLTDSIESMSVAVAESASKISKIIELAQTPIGVFEYTDGEGDVFCSNAFISIMGWNDVQPVDDYVKKDVFFSHFAVTNLYQYSSQGNTRIYRVPPELRSADRMSGDGSNVWIQVTETTEGTTTLGTARDITREMEEKIRIEFERDYDILTGIYNRRGFQNYLDTLFVSPEKLKTSALLMCDLDNLKYVNDTYGHESGDKYIKAMAEILKDFEKYNAVISRRSGDEFNVFLYGYNSKQELRDIIFSVYDKIGTKHILLPQGNRYTLHASGGIAYYPDDARDIRHLIRYADFAMYTVKHTLKGGVQEFNKEEYNSRAYLLHGHEALERLLEKRELVYALQPIYDVHHDSVYGYEMLMRSMIPELSSPADILNLARSESKLYLLEKATWFNAVGTFVDKIRTHEISPVQKVFFNSVGSLMLQDEDLKRFFEIYRDYLTCIVLELTETEQSIAELSEAKARIVRSFGGMIALDDFGAGYNGEVLLTTFSPDIIKIDMGIIRGIDRDEGKQQLVKNLISYTAPRNIKTLAEGVETKGEMEAVIAMGVHYLQGYYIGKPEMDIKPLDPRISAEISDARNKVI
ncbi:EAL domain-containing protein [Breznakiella homolactica]|uniref:EAL domain-containing protein n=1 Tax=Breznakiella homolactica TaxID=2798577 RepID=A0A7T7XRD8_9SPIR|nr:EAL domain-containing protein [Breznakiella homolactica]QQO11111.1 EAL domain-containing protein [Breznakiella homolactica]